LVTIEANQKGGYKGNDVEEPTKVNRFERPTIATT
jgi:hypothetical protein